MPPREPPFAWTCDGRHAGHVAEMRDAAAGVLVAPDARTSGPQGQFSVRCAGASLHFG